MVDRTPYLTAAEAAKILRVHRHVIYRMVGEGQLRAVRIGSGKRAHIRIPRVALDELTDIDVRTA